MILASRRMLTSFVWTKVKISLICGRMDTKNATTKGSPLLWQFSQVFIVGHRRLLINTSHTFQHGLAVSRNSSPA